MCTQRNTHLQHCQAQNEYKAILRKLLYLRPVTYLMEYSFTFTFALQVVPFFITAVPSIQAQEKLK